MSASSTTAPVAILGTGLIGGSLALALRQTGSAGPVTGPVVGWDRPEIVARALAQGVVDRTAPTVEAACAGAATVVLALPVGVILDLLPRVAAAVPAGALITDTGSTKRRICTAAAAALAHRPDVSFLGGHPMAGRAQGGLEHAAAGLFASAPWLLVGDPEDAPPPARDWAERLARCGARPLWTTAAIHDAALARLSHLPQLLSTALGLQLSEAFAAQTAWAALRGAAGPGLRDMLRLTASPYPLWRDIFLTNSDELDAALAEIQQTLDWLRIHLRSRELEAAFAAAAAAIPPAPEMER
ncbi:MAG: prephenate dehydrogenase [Terriglobales bacterium]